MQVKARQARCGRSTAASRNTELRKTDPVYDASRSQTVHCLYELDRHQEAWEAWRAASREGSGQANEEPTVFYGAMSACRSGDDKAGRELLRLALFRYPNSPLAAKARELINER